MISHSWYPFPNLNVHECVRNACQKLYVSKSEWVTKKGLMFTIWPECNKAQPTSIHIFFFFKKSEKGKFFYQFISYLGRVDIVNCWCHTSCKWQESSLMARKYRCLRRLCFLGMKTKYKLGMEIDISHCKKVRFN